MSLIWSGEEMPTYRQLILPTLQAVEALGGSGKIPEIRTKVLEIIQPSDELLGVMYPTQPDASVLLSRMDWARSYAKLTGGLESPDRGVYLLTALGRDLVGLDPEAAAARIAVLDKDVRSTRRKERIAAGESSEEEDETQLSADDDTAEESEAAEWRAALLSRLHAMHPDDFEEFVLYLLRLYGLTLERVGGTGDEGIDGIGTAPISDVLSSRVAVQVKRYNPDGKSVGRETVALFQRDAQTKGAERAILVTLGRFSEPAQRAAIATMPTVDLIDGRKLTDLMLTKEVAVKSAPVANPRWLDRFDTKR